MNDFAPRETVMPEAVPFRDYSKGHDTVAPPEDYDKQLGWHKIETGGSSDDKDRPPSKEELAQIAGGLLLQKLREVDLAVENDPYNTSKFYDEKQGAFLDSTPREVYDDLSKMKVFLDEAALSRPDDIYGYLMERSKEVDDLDEAGLMIDAAKFYLRTRIEIGNSDRYIEDHNQRVNYNVLGIGGNEMRDFFIQNDML